MKTMRISNRVFWGGVCIACSCILAGGANTQTSPSGIFRSGRVVTTFARDVIDVQLLRITDERGRVRAEIGTRADGTPYSVGINDDVLRLLQAQAATQRALPPTVSVSDPDPGKPASREQAYQITVGLVRARLKNPETAKFSPFGETTINETHAGIRYIVTGWVESVNLAGGVERLNYTATVRKPVTGQWQTDDLRITPQR